MTLEIALPAIGHRPSAGYERWFGMTPRRPALSAAHATIHP